jgi:hypothetical protein
VRHNHSYLYEKDFPQIYLSQNVFQVEVSALLSINANFVVIGAKGNSYKAILLINKPKNNNSCSHRDEKISADIVLDLSAFQE